MLTEHPLGCSETEHEMLVLLTQNSGGEQSRFTDLRQMVYLCIHRAEGQGISAYQILELIRPFNKKIQPVSIYRSLDFLSDLNLITKLESISRYIVRKSDAPAVKLYLICSNCGEVNETFGQDFMDTFYQAISYSGYKPTRKALEMSVICPKCLI